MIMWPKNIVKKIILAIQLRIAFLFKLMHRKRDLIVNTLFAFALITIFLGKNRGPLDRLLGFMLILGLLGILRAAYQAFCDIADEKKNYHRVIIIWLAIATILTFAYSLTEFTRPIINSGLIELDYTVDADLLILNPDKGFKAKKMPGLINWQIYFPRGIHEIKNIVCESKSTKKRVSWQEYVDFEVKDNYIESRHEFNLHHPDWRIGKLMIVYEYRLSPIEYFKTPIKIFVERFK